MVITEMRTRHVPMEVLGFEIDGEHVGQQCGEPDRDVGTVCAARILAVGLGMHGHWGSSVGSTPRYLVSPSSLATLIVVKLGHEFFAVSNARSTAELTGGITTTNLDYSTHERCTVEGGKVNVLNTTLPSPNQLSSLNLQQLRIDRQ